MHMIDEFSDSKHAAHEDNGATGSGRLKILCFELSTVPPGSHVCMVRCRRVDRLKHPVEVRIRISFRMNPNLPLDEAYLPSDMRAVVGVDQYSGRVLLHTQGCLHSPSWWRSRRRSDGPEFALDPICQFPYVSVLRSEGMPLGFYAVEFVNIDEKKALQKRFVPEQPVEGYF